MNKFCVEQYWNYIIAMTLYVTYWIVTFETLNMHMMHLIFISSIKDTFIIKIHESNYLSHLISSDPAMARITASKICDTIPKLS